MVHAHRRFALADVTLGGLPVGGATVDAWHDADGEHWCARLWMPVAHPLGDGVLEGKAADGRRFRGEVRMGEASPGPTRGRQVMAELLGTSPLVVQDPVT